MIVVSGEIEVAPEHHEALLELIGPVEEGTRAEAGCQQYEFWVHRTQPGLVHVFERWDSEDALAAHGSSDHFKAFFRGLKQLGPRRVDVNHYVVADQ